MSAENSTASESEDGNEQIRCHEEKQKFFDFDNRESLTSLSGPKVSKPVNVVSGSDSDSSTTSGTNFLMNLDTNANNSNNSNNNNTNNIAETPVPATEPPVSDREKRVMKRESLVSPEETVKTKPKTKHTRPNKKKVTKAGRKPHWKHSRSHPGRKEDREIVKMNTGILYLYKGENRRAVFIRKK